MNASRISSERGSESECVAASKGHGEQTATQVVGCVLSVSQADKLVG